MFASMCLQILQLLQFQDDLSYCYKYKVSHKFYGFKHSVKQGYFSIHYSIN